MNGIESVVLFLVDGLRPDGLARAVTPTIDGLMAGGCSTLEARTISPSGTLPCVTSLLYGSAPDAHGVWHNDWPGPPPPFPSLVDVLAEAGMTVSYYNWDPLRDLVRPRPPDTALRLCRCDLADADLEHADTELTEPAAERFSMRTAEFAYVYLYYPDTAGHGHGWMSDRYIRSIEHADAAIANVMAALEAAGRKARTLFVVTSDHGGHDNTHGTEALEDMIVPWIVNGPGVRQGATLAGPVGLIDTAPTVAAILGIARPKEWTGKVLGKVLDPTGRRSP